VAWTEQRRGGAVVLVQDTPRRARRESYRDVALKLGWNAQALERRCAGTLVQLSPTWGKRAYPILVLTMLIAIVFAVFIKVPTYSSGTAVIVFEGSTAVTASASGTVDKV
jgi:hypothetical protein